MLLSSPCSVVALRCLLSRARRVLLRSRLLSRPQRPVKIHLLRVLPLPLQQRRTHKTLPLRQTRRHRLRPPQARRQRIRQLRLQQSLRHLLLQMRLRQLHRPALRSFSQSLQLQPQCQHHNPQLRVLHRSLRPRLSKLRRHHRQLQTPLAHQP